MTIFITLSGANVPIHFRTTLIEGFIRYMHKQKKTLEYDEIDLIFSVFT